MVQGMVQEVQEFLADFSTTQRWDPNVSKAERDQTGPLGPGCTFTITTLWKGRPSVMKYKLLVLEGDHTQGRIVLFGESPRVAALDTILLSTASSTETRVDYRLEITFKGFLRPFVGLIRRDLKQLGHESIAGLTSTCAELFGSAKEKRLS